MQTMKYSCTEFAFWEWVSLFEHGLLCLDTASGWFDNGFKQLSAHM